MKRLAREKYYYLSPHDILPGRICVRFRGRAREFQHMDARAKNGGGEGCGGVENIAPCALRVPAVKERGGGEWIAELHSNEKLNGDGL